MRTGRAAGLARAATPLTLSALVAATTPGPVAALHASSVGTSSSTVALLALQAAPTSAVTPEGEVNLLLVSVFAFLAVFMVLTTLALLMVVLTRLFPAPEHEGGAGGGAVGARGLGAGAPGKVDGRDAAVLAAITGAASVAYPGMRVTRVEESR